MQGINVLQPRDTMSVWSHSASYLMRRVEIQTVFEEKPVHFVTEFRSEEALARQADVPTVSLSHFETGHRLSNAESLRRLADALAVSADYLLGRVKEPTGDRLTIPSFPRHVPGSARANHGLF